MTEYINKQALLAEYDCVHVGPPGGARKLIEEAPTADVAPVVHGRWELEGGDDDLDLYGWCSVCNRHWHEDLIDKFNYCPNCGADMKDGK